MCVGGGGLDFSRCRVSAVRGGRVGQVCVCVCVTGFQSV